MKNYLRYDNLSEKFGDSMKIPKSPELILTSQVYNDINQMAIVWIAKINININMYPALCKDFKTIFGVA